MQQSKIGMAGEKRKRSTTRVFVRVVKQSRVRVRRFIFDLYRFLFGYDLFISYSSRNVAYAEVLEQALKARRFRVFRDATGIESGALLQDILGTARKSRAMVLLLTSSAVESTWVAAEVAAHAGAPGTCRIIPILPDSSVLLRLPPELAFVSQYTGIREEPENVEAANLNNATIGSIEHSFQVIRQRAFRVWTARGSAVLAACSVAFWAYTFTDTYQAAAIRDGASDFSGIAPLAATTEWVTSLAYDGSSGSVRHVAQEVRAPEERARVLSAAAIGLSAAGNDALAKEFVRQARASASLVFQSNLTSRESQTDPRSFFDPDTKLKMAFTYLPAWADILTALIATDQKEEVAKEAKANNRLNAVQISMRLSGSTDGGRLAGRIAAALSRAGLVQPAMMLVPKNSGPASARVFAVIAVESGRAGLSEESETAIANALRAAEPLPPVQRAMVLADLASMFGTAGRWTAMRTAIEKSRDLLAATAESEEKTDVQAVFASTLAYGREFAEAREVALTAVKKLEKQQRSPLQNLLGVHRSSTEHLRPLLFAMASSGMVEEALTTIRSDSDDRAAALQLVVHAASRSETIVPERTIVQLLNLVHAMPRSPELRSRALAEIALMFARLRKFREARIVANECAIPTDRLYAYAWVLREYSLASNSTAAAGRFRVTPVWADVSANIGPASAP
jgi:hypothetical protein